MTDPHRSTFLEKIYHPYVSGLPSGHPTAWDVYLVQTVLAEDQGQEQPNYTGQC